RCRVGLRSEVGVLDLALYNGTVLTQATPARATAVGVCDRRIVVVGDDRTVLSAAGPATRRIDLAGRCLTPGFNDAHAHIWKVGQLLTTMLDLRRGGSIGEVGDRVAGFSARPPGAPGRLGRGVHGAALSERRAPTRDDLDRAAPDRPVVLTRTCGHICATNSTALERAGIGVDTDAPIGGVIERDERGRPTGLLHETAIGLVNRVVPPPSAADCEAMVVAGSR